MILILDSADINILFVVLPRCYQIIISLLYGNNHAINISNFYSYVYCYSWLHMAIKGRHYFYRTSSSSNTDVEKLYDVQMECSFI